MTKIHSFFNISAIRETAKLWRFKLDCSGGAKDNPQSKPFTFISIDKNDPNSITKTTGNKNDLPEIVAKIQEKRNK